MSKSPIIIFLAVLALFYAANTQGSTEQNTTQIQVPAWLNSSTSEYNRFLSDKYNYFITPKGNKVWVCTMNLAWNQMKRNFLAGENATFLNTNQFQQHMIDNLNSQSFTKDQLSSDAYYIFSGFGQQTVDKINFDVKEKFPLRMLPDIEYQLSPQDFISYSYLFKNFQFKTPFEPEPEFYFKNTRVEGFQARFTKQKKQIYYKYYNNRNDFMVGIETKSPNDEIILWKTNMTDMKTVKMQKILQMFEFFYNMPSQRINAWDSFIMPIVNLDLKRSYKEMLNLRFLSTNRWEYVISKMDERINLRITRFGVELQASGQIQLILTSVFGAKYFYLNNDFWVFMKEKNKKPYLVTLVSSVDQVWQE